MKITTLPLHEYTNATLDTYEYATKLANFWTKGTYMYGDSAKPIFTKQYYTVQQREGKYCVTNRFDPRVQEGLKHV